MGKKYTEAQNKATQKYIKNNYDRVMLTMPKGKKDILKGYISQSGETLNGFINRVIDDEIERSKG